MDTTREVVVGSWVEKYDGDAQYEGEVVCTYKTTKGKWRCVIEVWPQGFQMIVSGRQIRHKNKPVE